MWRGLRIAVLLTVLFVVAVSTWVDRRRTTDWDSTLWIGIFPIAADSRAVTREYVAGLADAQFADLEPFFAREARAHGVALERPVKVVLQAPVAEAPPRLARGAGVLATMAWSLRMRYYAWRHQGDSLADIRMFVLYHDPEHTPVVQSAGLPHPCPDTQSGHGPPQSTSVSLPFLTPSLHEEALHVFVPGSHTASMQSVPTRQARLVMHLPQAAPPQSMSVSLPFLTPSPHCAGAHV